MSAASLCGSALLLLLVVGAGGQQGGSGVVVVRVCDGLLLVQEAADCTGRAVRGWVVNELQHDEWIPAPFGVLGRAGVWLSGGGALGVGQCVCATRLLGDVDGWEQVVPVVQGRVWLVLGVNGSWC